MSALRAWQPAYFGDDEEMAQWSILTNPLRKKLETMR